MLKCHFSLAILLLLFAGCTTEPNLEPTPTLDPSSNAGKGQILFMGHCASCHTVAGDVVIVGPSLDGIATRAETRVPGMDAEGYLLESIIDPNNVTVPGYLPGSMQQNFTTQLTSEELDQIVAYLLTLK